jgi:hypothetical protein
MDPLSRLDRRSWRERVLGLRCKGRLLRSQTTTRDAGCPWQTSIFCCFDLMDGRSLEIAVCRMFLGWIHLFVPSREYVPAVAYDGWAVIV